MKILIRYRSSCNIKSNLFNIYLFFKSNGGFGNESMDQFTRSMRPYYESSTSFFCRTYRTAYRGRTLNSKQESDNISKKKENIENGMNF